MNGYNAGILFLRTQMLWLPTLSLWSPLSAGFYDWLGMNLQFNNKDWSPFDMIAKAKYAFGEFASIAFPVIVLDHPSSLSPAAVSWSPPLHMIKINTEYVSFQTDTSHGGLGFLFRDHHGNILKAISCPWKFANALEGKALVMRSAVLAI
ncbi:hypothetical protein NE237_010306 [Protea cynaroides]|uniref:Uncharacterized protein n=1 Tax=Protea cynaroides TaxID=273540 RepID=A0A9Q0KZH6_9MAGN|nr:hypothetical protein NE237_010306 [Protea cynaroides]